MSSKGVLTPCFKHSPSRCPFAHLIEALPQKGREFFVYALRRECEESREMSARDRRLLALEVGLQSAWESGDKALLAKVRAFDLMVRHGRQRRRPATVSGVSSGPGGRMLRSPPTGD